MNLEYTLAKVGCCDLEITDNSVYNPFDRGDFGIAMFISWWNGTQFVVNTNLADLNNTLSWTVNLPNALGLYQVDMFIIPKFIAGVQHVTDEIYYDYNSGHFYLCLADNTDNTPANPTNWQMLIWTHYTTFLANYIYNGYKVTQEWNKCQCAEFPITQLECRKWKICNCAKDYGKYYFTVKYPNGQIVPGVTYDVTAEEGYAPLEEDSCVEITLPTDGVYYIEIVLNLELGTVKEQIPLPTFCNIEACFTKLITEVLCNDIDPCCYTCTEAEIRKANIKRAELNKMIGIYMMIIKMTMDINYSYIGQTTLNATLLNNMMMLQELINKVKILAGRCGLCEDSISQPVITPCGGCQ